MQGRPPGGRGVTTARNSTGPRGSCLSATAGTRCRAKAAPMRRLTLRGPGGIGKTRLASRDAADEIERFEDGVLFVDLSASRDSESVLAAIARKLGLTDTRDEPLLDELTGRLREQCVL